MLVVLTLVVWVVMEVEWKWIDGTEGAVEGAECETEPGKQVVD